MTLIGLLMIQSPSVVILSVVILRCPSAARASKDAAAHRCARPALVLRYARGHPSRRPASRCALRRAPQDDADWVADDLKPKPSSS
ncbi:hypothetical protein RPC_3991 [Rhodopseudomonas palustris BisB18]|uniref:Uncharacterized protein n=1 Tax=Rhodopseudomonas palustris (strain BisB18) TaxID=316056 RepID=Q20ZB9_RHOPB